jgi:hypothetical protein
MVNNSNYIAYQFQNGQSSLSSSSNQSAIFGKLNQLHIGNFYKSSFAQTRAEITNQLRKTDRSITAQMRAHAIKWLSKQSTSSKESVSLHWKTVES